jgi:hypothetical protein
MNLPIVARGALHGSYRNVIHIWAVAPHCGRLLLGLYAAEARWIERLQRIEISDAPLTQARN